MIARLLKRLGYAVTTARGVGEALELASRERFDLLVSDIGLPDGSGLDIMRRGPGPPGRPGHRAERVRAGRRHRAEPGRRASRTT